jgi:hypothetical protein
MKMLFLLTVAVYMAAAALTRLNGDGIRQQFIGVDDGTPEGTCDTCFKEAFTKHFSDKFSCFFDAGGVYEDFHFAFYGYTSSCVGTPQTECKNHYCCGYMANGLKQCDVMDNWYMVDNSHFSLCEQNYEDAFATVTSEGRPKLRRDLCCENQHFEDCTLCKSFSVWDFTAIDTEHGGDKALQESRDSADGVVTFEDTWRKDFTSYENQHHADFNYDGRTGPYPPYAYANKVFPVGYSRAKLREFNDPPICVYAPNVAGRVIEVKVEPDEIGNTICVDDLHEDSLEKNNPGVTQACDTGRLRTCFPDAATDASVGGFAFLISCSESCADGDVDLWFRLRASTNKWTESGQEEKGTTKTELNTEMWCMWGITDMRADDGTFITNSTEFDNIGLDGDFSVWDQWPSDLREPSEPVVIPIGDSTSALSLVFAVIVLAFSL